MGAAELSLPSTSTEHRRFGGNAFEIPHFPLSESPGLAHHTFQNTVTTYRFSENYHSYPCQVDTSTSISAFDSRLGSEVTLWGAMRHGAVLSFHQCSFFNESSSILVLEPTFELCGSA
ncbi:hypothetical protein FVEG_15552 [Fusarium verticillioides 7600]|uniref:Uncharacterized protein n=1 Tax=Gibberella moniliformis (strain M3125 / FGSC 7600) TaxID=334819 RepID=W7MEW1_GIBM7|nr:hypothetical protein FVEG_15552 [Fusarium verticillioides 7600]EWG43297.1 hypothetical protein FVEG_15552 [Fusarium verticillioides 7600]